MTLQTVRLKLEQLKRNKLFESFVIAVIIISALMIGAKTYETTSSRFSNLFYWLDWSVTIFFLFEITVRILAEPSWKHFFKKGWNVFDFIIVVASLAPINHSEMLLLARLLRILRILRLVSLIPELRMLINALIKAIPRMAYIALLMFIIFYIYGAVGSFLFHPVDEKLWGNISVAMLTLFQVATFESWATAVLYPTMELYSYSWIYFLSFIFINAFIFLNMMIGIVLDVMQKESHAEQLESGVGEAADIHHILEELSQMTDKMNAIEKKLDHYHSEPMPADKDAFQIK